MELISAFQAVIEIKKRQPQYSLHDLIDKGPQIIGAMEHCSRLTASHLLAFYILAVSVGTYVVLVTEWYGLTHRSFHNTRDQTGRNATKNCAAVLCTKMDN